MSIQHVAAVLYSMPELRERGAAFALMAIADSADRETGYTHWKTLGAIGRAARLSIRGARSCARFLEAGGYVRTELRGDTGRQSMRWRVLFDIHGQRRAEPELYPPAAAAGVRKKPPAVAAAPPAVAAAPPAVAAAPPAVAAGHNETVPIPSLAKRASNRRQQTEEPNKIDRTAVLAELRRRSEASANESPR